MSSRERTDGRQAEIVGLLDIGTSKIACLIAALEPGAHPRDGRRARVLGVGQDGTEGLQVGVDV